MPYLCDRPPNTLARAVRLAKRIRHNAEHKRIYNSIEINWLIDYIIKRQDDLKIAEHVAKMRKNGNK